MTKVKRVIIVPTAPELSFSPAIRAVDYIQDPRTGQIVLG